MPLLKTLRTILAFGKTEPELFVVVWNGHLLEGEWPDAIAFSRADAEALIARSPGRAESYEIISWPLCALVTSSQYSQYEAQIRQQLHRGDRSPIMLRDEAERAKRAL